MPVAVTHPNGAGLSAAAHLSTLQTEGPFARLKAAAAAQQAAQEPASSTGTALRPEPAAAPVAQQAAAPAQSASVEVKHLDFSYPGLGECAQPTPAPNVGHANRARGRGRRSSPAAPAAVSWHWFWAIGSSCAAASSSLQLGDAGWRRWSGRRSAQLTLCCCWCCCHACHVPNTTTCSDGRPIQGQPPLITDMCLSLAPGSRCLLIGANGAGKTTLLKILAGKHMVPREQVLVLGGPPFHETELTTSGQLAYVGGNWTRDIAFAGTSIPLTVSGGAREAGQHKAASL